MSESSLTQFRSELRGWAAELSAASEKLPIFVSSICKRLGVAIARRGSVPRYKAYLSIDPAKDPPAIILLPDRDIGNFERFCVAHELGHYLLFKFYKAKPQSQSEYWKHEEICDEFARHLLIPDQHVGPRLTARLPDDDLSLCSELSQAARVPWIQAARKITDADPQTLYFRCSREADELRIVSTSLPRQRGKRTVIREQWLLHGALDRLLRKAEIAQCRVICDITDEILKCEPIKTLLGADDARVVAEAGNGQFPDIRIVARVSAPVRPVQRENVGASSAD